MNEIISFAWRNIWRNTRRTVITASAIGLGLALFVVAFAYTKGFLGFALEATTRSWTGEAQIHDARYAETREEEHTINGGMDVLAQARALPHVTAATPRVYGPGMAAMGDRTARVELVGIDLKSEPRVTSFFQKLSDGAWPAEQHHVLIGVKLAETLELGVGDKIVLTAADVRTGELNSHLARISGLIYSSNAYLDRQAALLPLQVAQKLLGLRGEIHEIALQMDIPAEAEQPIAIALAPLKRQGLAIRPWQVVQRPLAAAMELNTQIMWISVFVVFLIAAFGIVNTMTMSFLERYHEFGVLRALGTRPNRLMALVLTEAACLGAIGVALGLALGLAIYWPFSVYGVTIGGAEAYGVSFDRNILFDLDAVATAELALVFWVLTIFTALGTARRAAAVQPIEALRQI